MISVGQAKRYGVRHCELRGRPVFGPIPVSGPSTGDSFQQEWGITKYDSGRRPFVLLLGRQTTSKITTANNNYKSNMYALSIAY